MSAHTPNHPQDQDQIERLHEQFCGGIYDRAIVLQDVSYLLGRKRGRLEANAALLEALQRISKRCPAYTGDYTADASLSDFGGNGDDYSREMQAISDAATGDIARAAIAAATAQAGEVSHG